MSDITLVALICLAIFLIFVGIGAYQIWRPLQERNLARACVNWPTAGGEVLSSQVDVRTHYDRKRRTTSYTYCPNIRYAYEAGGVRRESSSIRFGQSDAGGKGWAERLVAKYPAGSSLVARYNPDDPLTSVLETEWSSQRFITGLIFVFAGTLIPAAVLFIFSMAGGPPDLSGIVPPQ